MPKKTTSKTQSEPVVTVLPKVEATIFTGKKLSSAVLAEVVVSLQHNLHHSTAATKTRGLVAGSTKKPWRQKGTGRARVGTKRTPLWRGGGIIFGPSTARNYHHKVNRQMLAPALNTLLALKAEKGEIFLLESTFTGVPKTKVGLKFLHGTLDPKSNLLIVPALDAFLSRALKNLSYVTIKRADQVNLLDVASVRHIIVLTEALPILLNKVK